MPAPRQPGCPRGDCSPLWTSSPASLSPSVWTPQLSYEQCSPWSCLPGQQNHTVPGNMSTENLFHLLPRCSFCWCTDEDTEHAGSGQACAHGRPHGISTVTEQARGSPNGPQAPAPRHHAIHSCTLRGCEVLGETTIPLTSSLSHLVSRSLRAEKPTEALIPRCWRSPFPLLPRLKDLSDIYEVIPATFPSLRFKSRLNGVKARSRHHYMLSMPVTDWSTCSQSLLIFR